MYFRLLVLFVFFINLNASTKIYDDSIDYKKVVKLVEKEEKVAKAYKDYIKYQGDTTDSISTLISKNYLIDGFSNISPFGKVIEIDKDESLIKNKFPSNLKYKQSIYDYYFSNKNRVHTKAPINTSTKHIRINLSDTEKYIVKFKNSIVKNKSNARNKYYLDDNGILHWYNNSNKYQYSINTNDEIVLDKGITVLNIDGTINSGFSNLFAGKDVLYAGQKILQANDDGVVEYLHLGSNKGIIEATNEQRNIGKTVIQFTRRSGGMLVNGDLYTWGNNRNNMTGINKHNYTNSSNASGTRYPVVNTLVRLKVKSENSNINNKRHFSSALRPKFIDFFSTVYHSTCGISTEGALYCSGSKGIVPSFTYTNINAGSEEMLYKAKYFNGSAGKKATKIFANNSLFLILANTTIDGDGYKNGQIFRWGYDTGSFSGQSYYYDRGNPKELAIYDNGTKVLFRDITYLLTIGYRRTAALSNEGDLYVWGKEGSNNCSVSVNNNSFDLCKPSKVSTSVQFTQVNGGMHAFIAKGKDENYYRIEQKYISSNKYTPYTVTSLNNEISSYSEYVVEDDNEILSMDLSSKLNGSSLQYGRGIVWVNGKNQLKGDYFTDKNRDDELFKEAIKRIKWKKIKVVEDDNGMCGIDIYNQMYCWGIVSYYRAGSSTTGRLGNTFMLPAFNTNLYDINKDYLLVEGGGNNSGGYLTNMTSGDWSVTDSKGNAGAFFIKYPTYIGGFNYEFIFK